MSKTNLIEFGENRVFVSTAGFRAASLAEFLFGDVMVPVEKPVSPGVEMSVEYKDSTEAFYCFENGEIFYIGQSEGSAARKLMDRTIYHLADRSCRGLMLHAAALERNGRVVILPGESGSGKSMLSSWLGTRGFSYLTDELVYLPSFANRVDTFTRPLNIKTPGLPLIRTFMDFEANLPSSVSGPIATMISQRLLLKTGSAGLPASSSIVVFPKYADGQSFSLQRLGKAKGAQLLMSLLINARNLDSHGFNQVSRLVRQRPIFTLHYSSFEGVVDAIDRAMIGDWQTDHPSEGWLTTKPSGLQAV